MLTPYARREELLGILIGGAATAAGIYFGLTVWPPLLGLAAISFLSLLLVVYFFRDPERLVPDAPGLMVSPADGTVTHIDEVEEPDFIGGKALRVSIFLSVLSVHINRCPCDGKVKYLKYKKGDFVTAMSPDSSHRNEANDLGLETGDARAPRVLVRQIAGILARRIVCAAREGEDLARGQRYGMIKFGSRTELFLPVDSGLKLKVKVGDPVRGGLTVIGELP